MQLEDQCRFEADGQTLLEHPIVATDVDTDDARYEVKDVHGIDPDEELVQKAIARSHSNMGRPEDLSEGYMVGVVVTTTSGEYKGSARGTHYEQPDNPDWEVA